jgi:hypothetical protein
MGAGSFGVLWIPDYGEFNAYYVVMAWYKNRGRTGQAWYFSEDEAHPLPLEEAENACDAVANILGGAAWHGNE